MVILAAAILSRQKGQVLLSRQFTSLSQSYVEAIWKLFPSLLNSNNNSYNKTHTNYIEHEHVRYIYQLLDDIYIVLLTNHLSNIIRDRQLVLTLSRMISEICHDKLPGVKQVQMHTFDILMGFDELINQAGLEDDQRNVMKQLLMESMEEDKEESERKIKEKKVKKVMVQKAKEFALQKMEGRRLGQRFELDRQSDFY